jgi:hypothetical protein
LEGLQVTKEEFAAGLNEETVLGLRRDRTMYKLRRALAEGMKRDDIVAILDGVIDAQDRAIALAEKLGASPPQEQLS